jgi:hypothetical protein
MRPVYRGLGGFLSRAVNEGDATEDKIGITRSHD